jgi:hypothetical protein
MAELLSILSDLVVRTFACPACGETIALGCERCRFCSAVIDQTAAAAAADLMDRVNLACSEAEDIRALFDREPSEYDMLSKGRGERPDFYLLPILLIRWWIRFGKLRANDKDLTAAKGDMKTYAFVVFGGTALGLLLILLSVMHWL